jgi:hypothetical protein
LRSSVPLAHPETIALLLKIGAPELTAVEGETILGSGRRYRAAEAKAAAEAAIPPEEKQFRTWMRSVSAANGNLKKQVPGKAHEEAITEAQQLETTFKDVQAFFAKRNTADAVNIAETMTAAAHDLSTAAAAGNSDLEGAALNKLGAGCAACHSAHREKLAEGGFKIK